VPLEIPVLPKIQFAGNRTSTMVAYPPSDESEPRQIGLRQANDHLKPENSRTLATMPDKTAPR
jgi:hypothetical protein